MSEKKPKAWSNYKIKNRKRKKILEENVSAQTYINRGLYLRIEKLALHENCTKTSYFRRWIMDGYYREMEEKDYTNG